MYISILIRMILGYIRIEVEGYFIEEFINECKKNKILIWNLKKQKGVKIYLDIGIKDFNKLRKICGKTKCKVKIKRKRGIPFLFYKYKKRKIFVIFLFTIAVAIYISSMYVWNIDIQIEENQELENIAEDLEELGIKRGVKKSEINTDEIINEIRLKRNDISWIGIDISGTNVSVKIVKADEEPEVLDDSEYCNIVAKKSGIITKIITQKGTALVKEGDSVQQGQILIAGYMEGKYTGTRNVHSLRRGSGKSILYRKYRSLL